NSAFASGIVARGARRPITSSHRKSRRCQLLDRIQDAERTERNPNIEQRTGNTSAEIRRRDADDAHHTPIEYDPASDRLGVRREPLSPQSVADDGNNLGAGDVLRLREVPAFWRIEPEDV